MNHKEAVEGMFTISKPNKTYGDAYPILVSDEKFENIFLVFKEIKYDFSDFKDALDILLKLILVFKVECENKSIHIVTFLTRFFFEIDICHFVNVNKLLNYLNKI